MSLYSSETESNYALNGKLILASTTLLFFFLLIFIFLHSFRYTCFRRNHHIRRNRHHALTNSTAAFAVNKGLKPSFLASLPTFTTSSATGDSCAVCMSEFATGDKGRALPSCRHVFHSHCIDVWFRSHSNCPICRTPVQPAQPDMVGPDNTGLGSTNRSYFPVPMWCPRKPLELEDEKLRRSYFINITLKPHM